MNFGWIRWQSLLLQLFASFKLIIGRHPLISRYKSAIALVCASLLAMTTMIQPAWASLTDDNFDGEIFALYAGNGSMVPPKNDLTATLKQGKAAVLVFYVDDSSDCKEFSIKISNLQGLYSRVTNFIPVRVDSLPVQEQYEPSDPAYYYKGYVPQTVIFNPQGEVKFDASGQTSFEAMDDVMREIFNLLPRSESSELKRRPVNEVSGELAN